NRTDTTIRARPLAATVSWPLPDCRSDNHLRTPSLCSALARALRRCWRCVLPNQNRRGSVVRGGSAERECKNLHARTEKLDLELTIGDGFWLSDQLVHTLFGHYAAALFVDVNPVSRAWRLPIDPYAKSHGRSWRCRAHDEMKIAGVKTVRDASIGL